MNKTTTNNRKDLLDELDNLRGLLGDAGDDVAADNLPLLGDNLEDDSQLPLLQAEPEAPVHQPATAPAAVAAKPAGVAKTAPASARPATAPAKPAATHDTIQQSLVSRANPFLKNAEAAIAARDAAKAATAVPSSTYPPAGEATRSLPPLTEAQINRLVDDVLKECLPHIEQTLRIHLNAALHRQNRNT